MGLLRFACWILSLLLDRGIELVSQEGGDNH
jgi:hypothetical protein